MQKNKLKLLYIFYLKVNYLWTMSKISVDERRGAVFCILIKKKSLLILEGPFFTVNYTLDVSRIHEQCAHAVGCVKSALRIM